MPDDWFDAHNHLHHFDDPAAIVAGMKAAGIVRCVVNATREDDWPTVESLHLAHPGFVLPAFGIHPWHAHTAAPGWQDRLRALLEKHPAASIGECGLDRWIDTHSIDLQQPVFLDQLRLARELDRPATIHCLKAWGPLLDAFAEQPPPSRFLLHSFNGSIETARRLLPLGARFSFSGHFLHPRKSGVLDTFRHLPADRLLLETDAPDMLPPPEIVTHPLENHRNHPANLPSIAAALAAALGLPPADLARLTRQNTLLLFP